MSSREDGAMDPREQFALFLECAGPGGRAEAARRTIPPAELEAARAAWSGRFRIGATERRTVEALLGISDWQGGDVIGYSLAQRPGYRYCFAFHPDRGVLIEQGYEREVPLRAAPGLPATAPELVSTLVGIGATRSEVRRWMGDPVDVSGWWPIETWCYPGSFALEFRHGVLEMDDERR